MNELVTYALRDGVARIAMDDGKLNVMSKAMLDALDAAFDRAATDEAVAVLSGREDIFSAGFDLKVLASDDPAVRLDLVRTGAELALKVLSLPVPVLSVCTGHAFPMGAFLLLASDVRIGVEGPYRIGLNEVAIGIPVPSFGLELGRQRLAAAYLNRTTLTGEMFGPAEAATAGFLDRAVTPDALEATVDAAIEGLVKAHRPSHASVKERLRAPAIAAVRAAIDRELTLDAYRSHQSREIRMPKAS